jgi:hypothetical protein
MKKLITLAIILALSQVLNATPAADTTAVTAQIGAGSKYATITVLDQTTGTPLSATISNVSVQNNNPEIATVSTTGNPNQIKVAAVATGSGSATVSCHVVYTDPGDGLQKSENRTIIINYTVIGAPHGAKLSLAFN